jgi:hypothetical protein
LKKETETHRERKREKERERERKRERGREGEREREREETERERRDETRYMRRDGAARDWNRAPPSAHYRSATGTKQPAPARTLPQH